MTLIEKAEHILAVAKIMGCWLDPIPGGAPRCLGEPWGFLAIDPRKFWNRGGSALNGWSNGEGEMPRRSPLYDSNKAVVVVPISSLLRSPKWLVHAYTPPWMVRGLNGHHLSVTSYPALFPCCRSLRHLKISEPVPAVQP